MRKTHAESVIIPDSACRMQCAKRRRVQQPVIRLTKTRNTQLSTLSLLQNYFTRSRAAQSKSLLWIGGIFPFVFTFNDVACSIRSRGNCMKVSSILCIFAMKLLLEKSTNPVCRFLPLSSVSVNYLFFESFQNFSLTVCLTKFYINLVDINFLKWNFNRM